MVSNSQCESDSLLIPAKDSVSINTRIFSKDNEFVIYPNPAQSKLTIDSKRNQPYNFQIFNPIGQLLISKEMLGGIETLDVGDLPVGLYSIWVKSEERARRLVFVKE